MPNQIHTEEPMTKSTTDSLREPILEVKNLRVNFSTSDGTLYAVDDISYNVYPGEVLGLVGESGSGKSVNVLTMAQLLNSNKMTTSGEALYRGQNLLKMSQVEIAKLLGPEIGFVFQNPLSSLNPVMKIGLQIAEGPIHHGIITKKEAKDYVVDLLNKVGINDPDRRYNDYPHQFSGGMRQRVMIAIAMACNPKLLICDEPTTALDVTVERQILDLLQELKDKHNLAIILITHNLNLAMNYSNRVAVMFGGKIMEIGSSYHLLSNPMHAYTKGLFGANLEIGKKGKTLDTLRDAGGILEQLPEGSLVLSAGKENDYFDRDNLLNVEGEPGHFYNTLYNKEASSEL